MHAVVVKVTVNDRPAAEAMLREQLVPRISQMDGFVTGHWLAPSDGQGMSVVVFESQQATEQMASQVQTPPSGEVTIESVEVREVVASA